MRALQRRRLLGAIGALAAAGTGAGCIGESPADGDDSGSHGPLRGDAVVDYPGMVDGGATVSGDGRRITYDDPERTFTFQYAHEGNSDDPDQLRVGRDLSGETMAAFVAPVYDDDAGAFAYHVFANEAFVAHADWYYVAGPSTDPVDTGEADFESLNDDVSRHVIGPVDAGTAGVVDFPPSEADSRAGDATGVVVTTGNSLQPTSPNVAWGFDYDAEAERLEVTHEGGDGVARDELRFESDADVSVLEDFEDDPVRAGNRATLSVPPSATVRVVWESSDDGHSATLASWSGPDA